MKRIEKLPSTQRSECFIKAIRRRKPFQPCLQISCNTIFGTLTSWHQLSRPKDCLQASLGSPTPLRMRSLNMGSHGIRVSLICWIHGRRNYRLNAHASPETLSHFRPISVTPPAHVVHQVNSLAGSLG